MSESTPLVSVILPTYNRADLIGESLQTVLDQTVTDFECIVIDDGSTDNTEQVMQPYLKDPRVSYHKQANAGVSVARNRGLEQARGQFIALQDSDDLWLAHKLEVQLPLFEQSTRVGLTHGRIAFFDSDTGQIKGEKFEGETLTHLDILSHRLPATQTLMFRREALEGFGGFVGGLFSSDDYVFCAHISEHWEVRGTNQLIAKVRQHPGQISTPSPKLRQGHRETIAYIEKTFGQNPESLAAIREAADYYQWCHFRQFSDAARESWRGGQKLQSLGLRLRAASCDLLRALPRPLRALTGQEPREYWGR